MIASFRKGLSRNPSISRIVFNSFFTIFIIVLYIRPLKLFSVVVAVIYVVAVVLVVDVSVSFGLCP